MDSLEVLLPKIKLLPTGQLSWLQTSFHVTFQEMLLTYTPQSRILEGQHRPWFGRLVGLCDGVSHLKKKFEHQYLILAHQHSLVSRQQSTENIRRWTRTSRTCVSGVRRSNRKQITRISLQYSTSSSGVNLREEFGVTSLVLFGPTAERDEHEYIITPNHQGQVSAVVLM